MFAIDYFADSLRDLAEYFKARLEVDKNNGTIDNKTIQMQGKI